jgi:hypothetical protein
VRIIDTEWLKSKCEVRFAFVHGMAKKRNSWWVCSCKVRKTTKDYVTKGNGSGSSSAPSENPKVRSMWEHQRLEIERIGKELISESLELANQGISANPGDAAWQMDGIEAENQLPVATTGAVSSFCNLSEELPSATSDQTPQQ